MRLVALSNYLDNMSDKIKISYTYQGVNYDRTCSNIEGTIQPVHEYKIVLRYGKKSMHFIYWQEIRNQDSRKDPRLVDIISNLCRCARISKFSSFEEFCERYCFNFDSRIHEQYYNLCKKKGDQANRVFGNELTETFCKLDEIW